MVAPERVFSLHYILIDGKVYEALVKTVPRSWRMDVWANKKNPRFAELIWIGRVPAPESAELEVIEETVKTLIAKKLKMFPNAPALRPAGVS